MTDDSSLAVSVITIPYTQNFKQKQFVALVPSLKLSADELFLRFAGESFNCRPNQPAVIIVLTGALNSPDFFSAKAIKKDDKKFEMELNVHVFDGPMAANDQLIGLVRMELGVLDPARYEFTLNKTILHFDDIKHPENITMAETIQSHLKFNCY